MALAYLCASTGVSCGVSCGVSRCGYRPVPESPFACPLTHWFLFWFLFPGSFSPSRGVPWGGYHSYLASDKSDRNDYLASDKSGMDGARERVGRGLEGKTCFGSTSLLELRRGEGCR